MMFGLTEQRPRHYRDMLRVAWENRDELPYAWRILRDGVCDGCALGLADGAPISLRSEYGTYGGRMFCASIRPGNLELHWPEGNVLVGPKVDPDPLEPDYNAVVSIEVDPRYS